MVSITPVIVIVIETVATHTMLSLVVIQKDPDFIYTAIQNTLRTYQMVSMAHVDGRHVIVGISCVPNRHDHHSSLDAIQTHMDQLRDAHPTSKHRVVFNSHLCPSDVRPVLFALSSCQSMSIKLHPQQKANCIALAKANMHLLAVSHSPIGVGDCNRCLISLQTELMEQSFPWSHYLIALVGVCMHYTPPSGVEAPVCVEAPILSLFAHLSLISAPASTDPASTHIV